MERTQNGWPGGRAAAAIRPAHPDDLAALSDFFAELSVQTRYLRFFGPVMPSRALLRELCGLADTIDAVVAVRGGVIIGHAMAADQAGTQSDRGARTTDIGVVVADAWQGRGIGAALVRALITGAQARGVTEVTMDVLPGNQRMLAMIRSHWPRRASAVPMTTSASLSGCRVVSSKGRRRGPPQSHTRGEARARVSPSVISTGRRAARSG